MEPVELKKIILDYMKSEDLGINAFCTKFNIGKPAVYSIIRDKTKFVRDATLEKLKPIIDLYEGTFETNLDFISIIDILPNEAKSLIFFYMINMIDNNKVNNFLEKLFSQYLDKDQQKDVSLHLREFISDVINKKFDIKDDETKPHSDSYDLKNLKEAYNNFFNE